MRDIRQAVQGRFLVILMAVVLICGCGGDIDSEYADVEAGLTSLRQGKYQTAAKLLRKGVKKHPDSSTAQCNLGIAYWFLEKPELAVEPLTIASGLVPYDSRPLEFLGLVFIDLNRLDEARAAVEAALACPNPSPRALTLMGLVEFRAGEIGRARDFFQQALSLKPDYPPALYNMAIISRDVPEDATKVYEYFEKYLRTAGADASGNAVFRADTAREFVAAVDQEDATEEISEVAAAGEEPAVDQEAVAVEEPEREVVERAEFEQDPVIVKAREALKNDNVAQALITLHQGIKENPDNPELLWALALIYDKDLGYVDKAEEAYSLFRERFPRDSRAGVQPQAVPDEAGDLEPSADDADLKPVQDPGAARVAFSEGIERHKAGDWSAAVHHYKKAVALDGEFVDAAFNLGLAYKECGDFDLAKESFLHVLELNPRLVRANYMLGVLCWDLNDNAEAIARLNRTLEIRPDYAKAHYLLGVIYRKEERFDMARHHFSRCIELEPDEPWSHRARRWLKAQRSGRR